MGRKPRGWEEDGRVEEIERDEDAYGREIMRNGRAAYMRQLEYEGRAPRRRNYDEEDEDDEESVGGGEFDLYNHQDSVVAYAVQLAMQDKEDQLVDDALARIRRAQMMGKNNVRLSQRELAALERKRQQTDDQEMTQGTTRRNKQKSARPASFRRVAPVPMPVPEQMFGPYPHFAPDTSWNQGIAASHPSSSSSSNRTRTPTMQSLRSHSNSNTNSNSPHRASYQAFSERMTPNSRPQSMPQPSPIYGHQPPTYVRPLPDDPTWVSPYTSMHIPKTLMPEPLPYQPQLPTDLRVGPQNRGNYPTAVTSPQLSIDRRRSVPTRGVNAISKFETDVSSEESEGSEEDEDEDEDDIEGDDEDYEDDNEDDEDEDEVQVVNVAQRANPGLHRRKAGTRSGK
ncbi:hypothetical protein N7495_006076 [Penicillium taxi]|uniref:uncharacterized protein n=1 Tax=Penicillium taxi TaxID=168475 RepID=UPI002544E6B9|nr:uncharacterized protein N7495_006076 [Penicillium taxi]KAJ5894385.1 hypothetical protein N7495_006076 [Penicillium taxi]